MLPILHIFDHIDIRRNDSIPTSLARCGDIAHRCVVFLILVLVGSSLVDRDCELYLTPLISYGEILFGLYVAFFLCSRPKEVLSAPIRIAWTAQSWFILFMSLFIAWTFLSWSVHVLSPEGEGTDPKGITGRIAVQLALAIATSRWVRLYGPEFVVPPFCLGIYLMFLRNFSVTAMAVQGLPDAIPVTNFSGVLLPTSALVLSLICIRRPNAVAAWLMLLMYVSTMLIYSLAAMVFMITALPAVGLAFHAYIRDARCSRSLKYALFASALTACLHLSTKYIEYNELFDLIGTRITNKINNISFTEAGKEHDQSGDVRFGQFQSSVWMTLHHPFFGVGKAHWEAENEKNKDWVRAHVTNDNPHNAFVEIMSFYGVPAILLFLAAIWQVARGLHGLPILQKRRLLLVTSIFGTYVLSGMVMKPLYLLSYFYFFAGVVFGIALLPSPTTHPKITSHV